MGYQGDNISHARVMGRCAGGHQKALWSPATTRMRQPAPAGSTRLWANLPPIRAFCRRVPAPALVALPEGAIQTRTDFGKAGYGGGAAKRGNAPLYLHGSRAGCRRLRSTKASGAMVGFNVHFHSLESVDYGDVFVIVRADNPSQPSPQRERCSSPLSPLGRGLGVRGKYHNTGGNNPTRRPSSRSCIALSISSAKKRSSS